MVDKLLLRGINESAADYALRIGMTNENADYLWKTFESTMPSSKEVFFREVVRRAQLSIDHKKTFGFLSEGEYFCILNSWYKYLTVISMLEAMRNLGKIDTKTVTLTAHYYPAVGDTLFAKSTRASIVFTDESFNKMIASLNINVREGDEERVRLSKLDPQYFFNTYKFELVISSLVNRPNAQRSIDFDFYKMDQINKHTITESLNRVLGE